MTPDGWPTVRLGEIASESAARIDPGEASPNLPYVGLEHIVPENSLIAEWGHADEVSSLKTSFRNSDILFGKLRPYLRKVALATFDGLCSTEILAIRARTDRILPSYLLACLSADSAIAFAVKTSAGTKMPRTSWRAMAKLKIPLPPLIEQCRIAELLDSVYEAVLATEELIEQTKRFRLVLLRSFFESNSHNAKPSGLKYGRYPKGWKTSRGSELFVLGGGYAPRDISAAKSGEILFLKVDDFNNPTNRMGLREAATRFKRTDNPSIRNIYPPGTIVFPKRGAAIFKNRVALLQQSAAIDPNLMAMICTGINARFMRLYLEYIGIHRYADTTSVPQINNKHLYPFPFPVPLEKEQREIVELIEAIECSAETSEETLRSLGTLKRSLLQDLLTERVRTPVPT